MQDRQWVRNPVDAFVLAKLAARGWRPAPPADRRTLIRRVTFDLTGLPPTPAAIAAFVADRRPDAYERVVRRLLASPRYGERWAQHWLDVVRFAETNGFELDADRPQAWRYRDYVVRALNEDRPYDRFLAEQIAGDELDPASFELRVATGFLRAGPQHVVSGNQDAALNRQEWLTEAVTGIGAGLLGLTIQCARCHDHKYDPIPQADYYRLQAFLAASDNLDFEPATPAERTAHDQAVKTHAARLKPVEEQIAAIEKPYRDRLRQQKRERLDPAYAAALATTEKQRTPEQQRLARDAQRMLNISWDELVAALSPADRDRRAGLRRQLHALALEEPAPLPMAPSVGDTLSPLPATHVLQRGDPHVLGPPVEPGFPAALGKSAAAALGLAASAPPATGGRRLALARWITRPDHPLTARVLVNRLWQHHFGRGLVATPNDFGKNGQPPTHPELLDWLAWSFARGEYGGMGGWAVGSGPDPHASLAWRLKPLHYLLVTSNTYRQSSSWRPPNPQSAIPNPQSGDPDNRLLWRMNRKRLEGEAIRDAVLAAAGTLNLEMGGPPVRVPLEPEVYATIFTEGEPDNLWPVAPDPRQHARRSLYLLRKRNVRLPMFASFDQPDMMTPCAARGQSVHALQALTLLNSDFMRAQSQALALRLLKGTAPNAPGAAGRPPARDLDRARPEAGRIERLFGLTLGRPPSASERTATARFLSEQTRLRRAEPGGTSDPLGAEPLVAAEPAEAAAWADLCLAALNLNEFVYVR